MLWKITLHRSMCFKLALVLPGFFLQSLAVKSSELKSSFFIKHILKKLALRTAPAKLCKLRSNLRLKFVSEPHNFQTFCSVGDIFGVDLGKLKRLFKHIYLFCQLQYVLLQYAYSWIC